MHISTLIASIQTYSNCSVFPPRGVPTIEPAHRLPDDVIGLYTLCGGLALFSDAAFPTAIVAPDAFRVANPIIFDGVDPEDLAATRSDRSWSWYLVGSGPNGQYVTIDCLPEQCGTCYNSIWIKHPGNSEIIATSFTELLEGIVSTHGAWYYWDA